MTSNSSTLLEYRRPVARAQLRPEPLEEPSRLVGHATFSRRLSITCACFRMAATTLRGGARRPPRSVSGRLPRAQFRVGYPARREAGVTERALYDLRSRPQADPGPRGHPRGATFHASSGTSPVRDGVGELSLSGPAPQVESPHPLTILRGTIRVTVF